MYNNTIVVCLNNGITLLTVCVLVLEGDIHNCVTSVSVLTVTLMVCVYWCERVTYTPVLPLYLC